MEVTYWLLLLPLLLQAVPAGILAAFAWRRRPTPGAASAAALMLAVALVSIANYLEKVAPTQPQKLFFANLQYVSFVFMPVAVFTMGMEYTGRGHRLTRSLLLALSIEPLVMLALVFTSPWHGLVHQSIGTANAGPVLTITSTRGPFFYVHVAYSYVLMALGCVMMTDATLRGPKLRRRQAITLLLGALVPWFVNVLHVADVRPIGVDLTPYAFFFTVLAVGWSFRFFRVLDVVPVPRDTVFEVMQNGMLVLDARDRIVDVNAAARRALGRTEDELIGEPAADFLPLGAATSGGDQRSAHLHCSIDGAVRLFEVRATALRNPRGRALGRLVELQDVTELERARQAERESQLHLNAAIESLPFDFWLIGPDGKCIRQNRACQMHWGNNVGKGPDDCGLDPQIAESWREDNRRLLAGEVVERERAFVIEGRTKHVFSVQAPILDGERVLGGIGVALDITPLKEAQARLEKSEAERAEVQRLARVGRWEWDVVRDRICWTEEIHDIFGTPVDAAPLRLADYLARVHPDDREALTARIRAELDRHEPFHASYRIVRADGEVRFVESRGRAVHEGGVLVRMYGTSQDVTEIKRAEQAALESESRYRTLMEHASDAIFVATADGRFVEVNSRACEMLGWSREELLSKSIADIVSPAEQALRPVRLDVIEKGKTRLIDRTLVRSDGVEVPTEISTTRLSDGRLMATARDIGDRLRVESERRELEEKIKFSQKMESLGILAGGIAHDFNNLLVGVLGNAGLALLELPENSAARRYVEFIETAAIRAADLCRQMLAYSGRGAFVIQPIDLSDLIGEMAQLLEVTISKKAALHFELDRNLPPLLGDATQIRQIAMNLLTNAAEAVGDGRGRIVVRTGLTSDPPTDLAQSYFDPSPPVGPVLFLEVADTGVGMTPSILSRIFDPFFTTKFTGRGLGLAAVLGIVRGHKGAIRVETEPGKGTIFTLYFPTATSEKMEAQRGPGPVNAIDAAGIVLVVDDEPTVLDFARDTLRRVGYSVLVAHDGEEAIEIFREHSGEISVVLLDATMPRMDGEETFQRLREIRADVAVVLSSGYSEREATRRFEGLGLAGFLQKPYGPTELLSALREVVRASATPLAP